MNTICTLSEQTLAFLLLRLFLAVRFIHAFYGKATNDLGQFDLIHLSQFYESTMAGFGKLLPQFALVPYVYALPWLELLLGLALLFGFKTRWSLFLTGLTYISLAFGMMLMKNYDTVGMIMMHVLMTAIALKWVSYNALCLDSAKAN